MSSGYRRDETLPGTCAVPAGRFLQILQVLSIVRPPVFCSGSDELRNDFGF